MRFIDKVRLFNDILNSHIDNMTKVKYKMRYLCEEQFVVLNNMKEIIRRKC